MNRNTISLISIIAALLLFTLSIPMFAQSPDDIRVQAGEEVAVPAHLLSPGTYTLKRVVSDSPEVYRLTNEDTMQVVGVFHVMPEAKGNSSQTEVALSAPDAAGLRMIQAWYPAGDSEGYRFSYTKKDARKLDALARSQVNATGSAGQP